MRTLIAMMVVGAMAFADDDLAAKAAGGRVVHASWGSPNDLDRLIDGEAKDACSLPGASRLPAEVTLAFPHDRVGDVTRVILRLPEKDDDARPQDVEVLVSIASGVAGFYSLGTFTLEDRAGEHVLDVPDLPVKFLRLRVLSNRGASKTLLSEVEVRGAFPPEETYVVSAIDAKRFGAFQQARTTAAVLQVKRSAIEERLFADAKDGKLDDLPLGEAALVASGVPDEAALAAYRAKLDALVAQAQAAVGGGSAHDRGKALLEWLHGGALKRYRAEATDMTGVLDRGDFNCVSSATLYDAIAKKLGMDTRTIEVPDHAFSILYDGAEAYDVETTSKWGFDPVRDKARLAEFEKQTGLVYIADRHSKQRREVRDVGTVAIVYYNRGVGFSRAKKFPEAFACYVKALDLDPGFSSALYNLVQGHVEWGYELSRTKEFGKAIEVIDEGLSIDPASQPLRQNLVAAITTWGLGEVEAKRYEQALSVFENGLARDHANFYYARNLRYVYAQWAQDRVASEGPAKGLETIERALVKFPGDVDLRNCQVTLYDEWAKRLVDAKEWREAIARYDIGLLAVPQDKLLSHNRVVTWIEWAESLTAEGKLDEAVAVLEEGEKANPGERAFHQNRNALYATAGDALGKAGKFDEAAAMYEKGMAADPKDRRLKQNRDYWLQQWAGAPAAKGDVAVSVARYADLEKRYPGEKDLLKGRAALFIDLAKPKMDAKDWEGAIAVYRQARAAVPEEKAFEKNLSYCWNSWAKESMDAKDWKAAIAIYEKALKDLPNDKTLAHNKAYCEAQFK